MKHIGTSTYYAKAFWEHLKGRPVNDDVLREYPLYDIENLVPTDFAEQLEKELQKYNPLRQHISVAQTQTADSNITVLAPFSEAVFLEECMPIPENTGQFAELKVRAHRLAIIIRLANITVQDASFDLPGALAAALGRSFGKAEEKVIINGDGATEPWGLLHPDQGAEIGVTAANATELTFDEVRKLYFSLEAEYRREAVWLMSDETAFYLRTLKDSAGNYLWRDHDDTIFSRPVLISPYMPGIAAGAAPVAFGDLSYYWFIQRSGATVRPLVERYILHGQMGFAASERVDGRLVRREAVKVVRMAG